MKVIVNVKDSDVLVECGTGRNKVKWLCNLALHRFDREYWINTGVWSYIEDEAGNKITAESVIAEKIKENSRVFLKFEETKVEEVKASKASPAPAAKKK